MKHVKWENKLVSQKKVENKAKEALELVYSDVLGPFEVASLSGSKYAVSFIDEYTKYAVVKYTSNKSQVLDKFTEYVAENGNLEHYDQITVLNTPQTSSKSSVVIQR